MIEMPPLPRAGAILAADRLYENRMIPTLFVRDEHDDVWSIVADLAEESERCPVQRHTTDGWVAAVFHRDEGFLKIVAPGESHVMRTGQSLFARAQRTGVRWEFYE